MDNNAASFLIDRHARGASARRIGIVYSAGELTYGEIASAVDRAAYYLLHQIGIAPGQRAVLYLPDCPDFVFFFLASLKIGVVAVPVNTFTGGAALAFYVQDTQASVLISRSDLLARVSDSIATFGSHLRSVVSVDRDEWQRPRPPVETFPVTRNDSAFWLYTSGSTGQPKAVMHHHGGIRACVGQYGADVLDISASDRCYSASKMFFAYGLGNSLLFPFSVGAATILNAERSEPNAVARCILEHQPTLFFAVPTLYHQLLSTRGVDHELLAGVRMCVSAGEPLPESLQYQWMECTGQPLYDGIGTTEAMHIFCSNRRGRLRPGTSGRPVRGCELKIVDANDREVGPGEPGQLWVRSDTIASGYWNRQEATLGTFRGEWLVTGDIYQRDADDFFRYLGRKDDVFKSSGQWVVPREIEEAFLTCPHVKEAVVLGICGASGLTTVKAFVVLTEGSSTYDPEVARRSIYAYLTGRLPKYKLPADIEFLPDLPRTATGKISRATLRENPYGNAREPLNVSHSLIGKLQQ